jgi:hypothetical protein
VSSPTPEQREYAELLIAKATRDARAAHALAEAEVLAASAAALPWAAGAVASI